MAKRGLGRGLSSLIPSRAAGGEGRPEEVSTAAIKPNPRQPRRRLDGEALEELTASVSKHGLIQPVVVRPTADGDGEYELIAGERRWRAAREAGLKTIPVVVRQAGDEQSLELALIENLQREDLNPVEEARAYQRLLNEHNLTQEELGRRLSKSRTAVANTLRLLNLSADIQALISEGHLSAGHARALLMLDDQGQREKLAADITSRGLSVRQAEELAGLWRLGGEPRQKAVLPAAYKTFAKRMRHFLGAPVKVKLGRRKHKVIIEFSDQEELERIASLIAGQTEAPTNQ